MNKKRTGIIIIAIIIVFAAAFFGFNLKNSSDAKNLNKSAQDAIAKGEYQKAVDIYSNLYDKTNDATYIEKKRAAVELMSSQNYYDLGMEYLKKSEYIDAAKSFIRVREDDNVNYQKSQQRLQETTQKVIMNSDSLAEDSNYEASLNLLNAYYKVMPKEKLIKDKIEEIEEARDKFKDKKEEEKKQKALSEQKEKEAREKAEQLAQESKQELEKKKQDAKSNESVKVEGSKVDESQSLIDLSIELVGKTYLVTNDNAKIYAQPNKNSELISTIPMGSEVYIYEAKPESSGKVWCHAIIKSSDTFKSYDAWISSNNLK